MNFEELLKAKLKAVDVEEIVRDYVEKELRDSLQKKIGASVDKYAQKVVEDECKKQMENEVMVSTGWGDSTKYKTFEEFFRKTIEKKTHGDYNVKREIERKMEAMIETLISGKRKEIIDAVLVQIVPTIEIKK